MQGTLTGKLATVKKDKSPRIVPDWLVLDESHNGGGRLGDIIFMTGVNSLTTRIAERYMGKDKAETYGKRNSGEDEVVIRVKPTKILAEKDIAN